MNKVTAATEQLVRCEPLRKVLGLLLQMGNKLNQGSFRSGAEGFKLECLPRLCEIKTNGQPSSLLQYAVAIAGGQGEPATIDPATPPLASFSLARAVRRSYRVPSVCCCPVRSSLC